MAERNGGGPDSPAQGGLAALGIAAFAVVCCAAFPLLAAVAGGLALGTLLGVGAGVVAAVLLIGMVVVRTRRRRACEAPTAPDLHPNGGSSRARSRERVR